ncbi:unnamed protein product [Rhizophagus irregularis]|nr:unnamed protein product [Rhizophagus irregularis]
MRPPPPTHAKIASISCTLCWRMISIATVPWPAITYGSSYGGILVSCSISASRAHSCLASSKSFPYKTTLDPSLLTLRHLIVGVALASPIKNSCDYE